MLMDAAPEIKNNEVSIAENLSAIRHRIQLCAEKFGRDPQSIMLVAVSKTKPISLIKEARKANQVHFGENRAREMRDKHEELSDVYWHMIGNLQRNKVKYIAEYVHLIHSLDSEKLLEEINKQASKYDRSIDCLLEVNISGEEAKSGMEPAEVQTLLAQLPKYPHVSIKGLMGMASFTDQEDTIRHQFRSLRELYDELKQSTISEVEMKYLSMGMSNDFEIAIEEGANIIRVGSAIFGSRNK